MKTIKYLSLFSGIGGFEVGLENSKHNFESIGASEIDKYAKSIYIRHFPQHKQWGDVTKIKTEELPDFDFLVGGFPCQAFSVAGKRRGFDDTRGTLFFEIARVLKDKRPRYFLLENVRGLLSHNKGETFQRILEILSDLGYNVQWTLLNSKDFGVPQRRERVFIKGYSRRECAGEVLSFREHNEANTGRLTRVNSKKPQSQQVYEIDGLSCTLSANGRGQGAKTGLYKVPSDFKKIDENIYMTTTKENDCFAVTTRPRDTPLHKKQDNYVLEECIGSTQKHAARTDGTYSPTLTEAMGKGGGHVPMLKERKIRKLGTINGHQSGEVFHTEGLSPAVCCTDYKNPLKILETTKKGYKEAYPNDGILVERAGRKVCKGMVQKNSTGTLRAKSNWGTVTPDYRIRRLTPLECERLQAFPDNWTQYGADGEEISDTQRYKCIGNAVTTTVITAIVNEMFEGVN